MLPYQERVVAEKKELDEKLEKRGAFIKESIIFGTSPKDEQHRLICQRAFMAAYSNVLGERIAAFPG